MISRYSTDGRKARGKYGQKSGLFRKKGGGKGRRQMLSESVSKLLGELIEIERLTLILRRLWPRSEQNAESTDSPSVYLSSFLIADAM